MKPFKISARNYRQYRNYRGQNTTPELVSRPLVAIFGRSSRRSVGYVGDRPFLLGFRRFPSPFGGKGSPPVPAIPVIAVINCGNSGFPGKVRGNPGEIRGKYGQICAICETFVKHGLGFRGKSGGNPGKPELPQLPELPDRNYRNYQPRFQLQGRLVVVCVVPQPISMDKSKSQPKACILCFVIAVIAVITVL